MWEFFLRASRLCWPGSALACTEMCNRSDYRQCRDFRDGLNVSEQQGGLVCSHVHVAIESCHLCLSKVVLSSHGCNSPNLQACLCSRQMGKRKRGKKAEMQSPAQQELDSSWAQQNQGAGSRCLTGCRCSHRWEAEFWLLAASELQAQQQLGNPPA